MECETEPGGVRTGLARSLMQEIAQLLEAYAARGEAAAIDLVSLPMTPADRAELEDLLGRGDVAAVLDVAGTSEIRETAYSGVWWVRHLGAGDKVAAERIEIVAVPDVLVTHADDIAAAATRLRGELAAASASEEPQHG